MLYKHTGVLHRCIETVDINGATHPVGAHIFNL